MSFNQNKAKQSATSTAGIVVGMIGGHIGSKMIREKAPANIAKFAPGILAAAAMVLPAFMVIKDETVANVLTGVAASATVAQLNQLSKDETGAVATTGVKGMLAKYVPQLGSIEEQQYEYYQEAGDDYEEQLLLSGSYEEEAYEQEPSVVMMSGLGYAEDQAVQTFLAA